MNRRTFVQAATAFTIVPRHVLGGAAYVAPSDKVTLAAIGMGRQGIAITMDLLARPDVQVIAVADCNRQSKDYIEYGPNALLKAARKLLGDDAWAPDLASPGEVRFTRQFKSSMGAGGREPARRLVEAYYSGSRRPGSYKGCNAYADFRELLEKEKDLDSVYIATPDHWHAPIAIAAMRKRKHVLCQKPMAHSVGEARRMGQVAREMKVATSVTVNNPSTPASARIKEWIDGGAIGTVREVHNWSSRPFWPQGLERPAEAMPIPDGLDWNLWLGPAPERPFHNAYLPFVWRGWYDFGCGSFGDMGCYSFAGLFKILNLTAPLAAEASTSEAFEETYPKASLVNLWFPENQGRAPLRLTWYDGGLKPPRPAGISSEDSKLFVKGAEGVMYVGDKGMLLAGFNGDRPRLIPSSDRFTPPAPDPREDQAIDQWLAACKGGPEPLASIPRQAPVTEALLMGCLAQRLPGERLAALDSNSRHLDPPYRGNWER